MKNRKRVALWLWSGVGLITLMLIIGGITRLTGSGLSMSDWNLVMGAIPPMNEAEWDQAFERYKQFPEYRQLNKGMSLEAFKDIFFWEYLHRLTGRVIGLVFIVPFLVFWLRGYLSRRMLKRLGFLFGLGALQGLMGWIMVKSGLADNPYVSHYRLALHLLLAFALIGLCVWLALDMKSSQEEMKNRGCEPWFRKWTYAIASVFLIQVTWGAFTAGLDAGYIYNTFPLMNGQWFPRFSGVLDPPVLNLVEHPGIVQWIHRVTGTVLLILVFLFWLRIRAAGSFPAIRMQVHLLLLIIVLQYGVGVLTLLYHVPVFLGVTHQAMAVLFWIVLLMLIHRAEKNLH